jgi:hypothetical protein
VNGHSGTLSVVASFTGALDPSSDTNVRAAGPRTKGNLIYANGAETSERRGLPGGDIRYYSRLTFGSRGK